MSTIALRTLFPRGPLFLNPVGAAASALLLPRFVAPILQMLGSSFALPTFSLPISVGLGVAQTLSGIYLVALAYFSSCGFPRHIHKLHQEDSIQDVMKPLEAQLSRLINLEGEAKDLIQALGAEFNEIKAAFDELSKCKEEQEKLIQSHEENHASLTEALETLSDEIDSAFEAYEYLNEGPGQFEEYESYPIEERATLKGSIATTKKACASEGDEMREQLFALLDTCGGHVGLLTQDGPTSAQKIQSAVQILEKVEELRALHLEHEASNEALSDCVEELRAYAGYQKDSCEFSQLLAQRTVAQAFEDYCYCDESDLSDRAKELQKGLNRFKATILSGDFPVEDYSDEDIEQGLRDWFRPLKEAVDDIAEGMQSKLDDISRERADDPHDPEGEAALGEMIDWVAAFSNDVDATRDKFIPLFIKLVQLQRQRLELEARLVDHDKTQNKAVLKLIGKLKSAKGEQKHTTARELGSVAHSHSPEHQVAFNKIIELIRRDEINRDEPSSDKGKLRAERDYYVLCLRNPPKDGPDPIDLYIQWHRRSRKLEMLLEKPQQDSVQEFLQFPNIAGQPSVGERIRLVRRYCLDFYNGLYGSSARDLIALYKEDNGDKKIIRMRSSTDNPLDSALAGLIRVLPKSQIRKAVFQHSGLSFSEFERGMLKLAGKKNPDAGFCTRGDYEKIARQDQISRLHLLDPNLSSLPGYLSAFNLPQIVYPEIPRDQLDQLKAVYSLLTARLAFTFLGDVRRQQIGLPSGHAIMCLLVDRHGRLISWGVNTIGSGEHEDLVRHAEVNALTSYFLRNPSVDQLPEGCMVFSSLKPCEMCAGAIYDTGQEVEYEVHYSRDDPGANAKTTILDQSPRRSLFLSDMEIFQTINQAYLEKKAATPDLNAAGALDPNDCADVHVELVNQLKMLLETSPAATDYLVQIYAHIAGEALDIG